MRGARAFPRVAAVVVTYNRPAKLAQCLAALWSQDRRPDLVIVADNGGDPATALALSSYPHAVLLGLGGNLGPAAAFGRGIREALAARAELVWLMDDDGRPADRSCLSALLATSFRANADLVSPLVRDIEDPERLAFPIRLKGRTRFSVASLSGIGMITGFAHLFNGALIPATTFRRVGFPDPRLFIRGDEVEFLFRMRQQKMRILTDPEIAFLHPSSDHEIFPILGGWFHAVVPGDPLKRFYLFRNRGWIFARYRMWGWLAADHVRYACWYLVQCRDAAGYLYWLRTTWQGVLGPIGTQAADGTHSVMEPVL